MLSKDINIVVESQGADLSSWITAVSTGLAFIVAAVAFCYQLFLNRQEVRKRQAYKVSSWYSGGEGYGDEMTIHNGSDLPIYNVMVALILVQGAGPKRTEDLMDTAIGRKSILLFPVIGPGTWVGEVHEVGWGGMNRFPGSEITFTDYRGKHWTRKANGEIKERNKNSIEVFNLSLPFTHSIAKRSK